MNVTIDIHFSATGGKVLKSGSFPLRGRNPENVAYQFWKQIQKEQPHEVHLEEVIVNGDQDITELVLELEQQEQNKIMNADLPF